MTATSWAGLTWDEVSAETPALHRNWSLLLAMARDRGLDPGDVEAIQLSNSPEYELPRLVFTGGRMLTPQGLFVWSPEERGTGDPIPL